MSRRAATRKPDRCLVEGCERATRKRGRCWGHYKAWWLEWQRRRARFGEVEPDEVPDPLRALRLPRGPQSPPAHLLLVEAALALADASSDQDYTRGYDRLRKAAVRYSVSLVR